jgi:peptidoglycan/xylan/chitin deacetylase (PgdA/CDA1 family)
VAVASSGPKEVVLSRSEVTGLLSDFGRRAQAQALHPEHRLHLATAGPPDAATSASGPAQPGAITPPPPPPPPPVDCHTVKCIALTFDDGPGPYTRELLATLARYHARSTFFLIGQSVAADPAAVRAEVAAGHEVGNHTWSHPELTRLSATQVSRQLSLTDDAIRRAIGRTPAMVRPPYGAVNSSVSQAIARPVILWNRDTLDWKVRNAQRVASTVITQARPGDIILLHDIHPTSVQAVPAILTTLGERGYHFVTVSQLFAGTTLIPSRSYFSNPKMSKPEQDVP